MSQQPEIDYAPRHAAISAILEVVATPPIPNFVEGEIRNFRSAERFRLKARTERPPYPRETEWIATGNAEIVNCISADLQKDFKAIWGDTNWIFVGDEVVWIPAQPVSASDRETLITAYCSEIGAEREAELQRLTEQWFALRERLG